MIEKVSQEELAEFLVECTKKTKKSWNEIIEALNKIPFYKEMLDNEKERLDRISLLQQYPTTLN